MFYIRHNDAISLYRHRLAFMLYAYWYVKKLRSIGLKTQKMSVSLTIIKFIGDELISDKSVFGFRKFC